MKSMLELVRERLAWMRMPEMRIFDTSDIAGQRRLERDDYLGWFRSDHPLLIVDGARIEWFSIPHLLSSAARHAGNVGVVLFYPWSPGATRLATRFRAAFPTAKEFNPEQLVVLPADETFPLSALELRRELGAHSGLWLIGTGCDESKIVEQLSSSLGDPMTAVALDASGVLPFCLAFDENDQSILLLRLTESTRSDAEAIKHAMSAMRAS